MEGDFPRMSVLPDPGYGSRMGTMDDYNSSPGSTFLPWQSDIDNLDPKTRAELLLLNSAVRKRATAHTDPLAEDKLSLQRDRLDLDRERLGKTGSSPKENELQTAIQAARNQASLPDGADTLPDSPLAPNFPMVPDAQMNDPRFAHRMTSFSIEDPSTTAKRATNYGPEDNADAPLYGPQEHYLLDGADPDPQSTAEHLLAAQHPTRQPSNAQQEITARADKHLQYDILRQRNAIIQKAAKDAAAATDPAVAASIWRTARQQADSYSGMMPQQSGRLPDPYSSPTSVAPAAAAQGGSGAPPATPQAPPYIQGDNGFVQHLPSGGGSGAAPGGATPTQTATPTPATGSGHTIQGLPVDDTTATQYAQARQGGDFHTVNAIRKKLGLPPLQPGQ